MTTLAQVDASTLSMIGAGVPSGATSTCQPVAAKSRNRFGHGRQVGKLRQPFGEATAISLTVRH